MPASSPPPPPFPSKPVRTEKRSSLRTVHCLAKSITRKEAFKKTGKLASRQENIQAMTFDTANYKQNRKQTEVLRLAVSRNAKGKVDKKKKKTKKKKGERRRRRKEEKRKNERKKRKKEEEGFMLLQIQLTFFISMPAVSGCRNKAPFAKK